MSSLTDYGGDNIKTKLDHFETVEDAAELASRGEALIAVERELGVLENARRHWRVLLICKPAASSVHVAASADILKKARLLLLLVSFLLMTRSPMPPPSPCRPFYFILATLVRPDPTCPRSGPRYGRVCPLLHKPSGPLSSAGSLTDGAENGQPALPPS